MSNIDAIPWPKDFPELKRLDNLLRCGICYDYLKTPMITSCSHNYCSLCIRKYMQYKSMCPTCYEETFEVALRNNRSLEEFITLFTGIRDKIIRHLKIAAIYLPKSNDLENSTISASSSPSSLQKQSVGSSISGFAVEAENLKMKGKSVARRLEKDLPKDDCDNGGVIYTSPVTPKAESSIAGETSTANKSGLATPVSTKIPAMFYSPKKSLSSNSPGVVSAVHTVPCPVCNVDIPERNINIHLDKCLARVNSPPKCGPKVSKRDSIPKRVYSMMLEKDLRKWLKNYGLSTAGDKKTMISRLQRYTVLHNSECDSDNPRSINEVIRQVEREEKEEKLVASNLGIVKKQINRNSNQSIIDVENKKYIEKNKSHFESLINAMRERDQLYIKPTGSTNRIESDCEDEDSFYYKETMRITDDASTSENHQLNGVSQHNPSNGYMSDSDEIVEVYCQSPDLSKSNSNARQESIQSNKKKSVVFTHSSLVEADIYINDNGPSSSKNNFSPVKAEPLVELYEKNLDVAVSNVSCKNEFDNSDASEESNESISLLADYEESVKENLTSLRNLPEPHVQITPVSQSQINDPDFIITESELISTNLSEDSQDLFLPRRSKRKHSNIVQSDLPKRIRKNKRIDK